MLNLRMRLPPLSIGYFFYWNITSFQFVFKFRIKEETHTMWQKWLWYVFWIYKYLDFYESVSHISKGLVNAVNIEIGNKTSDTLLILISLLVFFILFLECLVVYYTERICFRFILLNSAYLSICYMYSELAQYLSTFVPNPHT